MKSLVSIQVLSTTWGKYLGKSISLIDKNLTKLEKQLSITTNVLGHMSESTRNYYSLIHFIAIILFYQGNVLKW